LKTWEICSIPGLFLHGSADSLAVMVLSYGSRSLMGDETVTLGFLVGSTSQEAQGFPPGHVQSFLLAL